MCLFLQGGKNLTVCKILENKLAICKFTQDLFVRALPHQWSPLQSGQRTYIWVWQFRNSTKQLHRWQKVTKILKPNPKLNPVACKIKSALRFWLQMYMLPSLAKRLEMIIGSWWRSALLLIAQAMADWTCDQLGTTDGATCLTWQCHTRYTRLVLTTSVDRDMLIIIPLVPLYKRQEVETTVANAIGEGLTGLKCTCVNTCFQGKQNTRIGCVFWNRVWQQ